MKKPFKIFIILFIGALIALIYFSYPIIKERYFSNSQSEMLFPEKKDTELDVSEKIKPDTEEPNNLEKNEADESDFIPEEEATTFRAIEKEDCLDGCSSFENPAEKEYCLQVCDSIPPEEVSDSCSEKSGLEKDYCYKALGIENKNLDECKKITDKNIRASCIETVTNKILERSDDEELRNP